MSFLQNLFSQKQNPQTPIGVQFFFDWKQISDGGIGHYGNFVREKIFPYFYPGKMPRQIIPFVFFEGDIFGQVQIPYVGSTQERVLKEVMQPGSQHIYVLAIFGPWLNIPGGPEKIDKEFHDQKILGYIGMTHAVHLNTFQTYAQFATGLGLPVGGMISNKEFTKMGWSWMDDEKLREVGFEPRLGR